VLQRREARLAHDALQHHAARDHGGGLLRFQRVFAERPEALVQRGGEVLAAEIVRIGLAGRAQRLQLLAAFVDELVVLVLQTKPPASGWLR